MSPNAVTRTNKKQPIGTSGKSSSFCCEGILSLLGTAKHLSQELIQPTFGLLAVHFLIPLLSSSQLGRVGHRRWRNRRARNSRCDAGAARQTWMHFTSVGSGNDCTDCNGTWGKGQRWFGHDLKRKKEDRLRLTRAWRGQYLVACWLVGTPKCSSGVRRVQ